VDRGGAGSGRLAADVDEVGALLDELRAVLDGTRVVEEATSVGEGVGRDVDDAHDERTLRHPLTVPAQGAVSPCRRAPRGARRDGRRPPPPRPPRARHGYRTPR